MATSRKILVVSALALGCHFVSLAVHSAFASSIVEFVLIILAATACFQTANRASGFARRFWRLMGIAFALYSAGQVLATYYDSVLHASLTEWWPSDILFLYHVALMAMALFLSDDSAESRVYRWQRWLDFLQIGIVSFSAYFFFLYLPLHSVRRPEEIDALYWWVFTWRNFVLAMATSAIGQQLKLAAVAVLASFGCSSVRLLLSQRAQSELLAQQKRSAESLRTAEAKFRGLLESAPDPMVVVNREGRIVLVNAQAEETFGYRREDMLGQPMDMLVPEKLREKCLEYQAKFLGEPRRASMGATLEIYGLHRHGSEFPVEIKLSLLETEEGLWGCAAIRDLTERRKLEQRAGFAATARCGNHLRTAFRAHSPPYHGYGPAGGERARDREARRRFAAGRESTLHVGLRG